MASILLTIHIIVAISLVISVLLQRSEGGLGGLGGGMSNIDYIYKNINSSLKKYVVSDTIHTKVIKNIHGDSSGVRGAAWL